jgi:hypothetical protein
MIELCIIVNKPRNSLPIKKQAFILYVNTSTHISEEHYYTLYEVSQELKD